mmetsp:Transcript_1977/g.4275  ORF Transcript_1977/g.4275 Transcript_1977/m.4275 type:complete len:202 (+) Transcript_1977:528-1133(+)
MHEGNEREPSRNKRLAILGEIDPRYATKRLKQILQIGLGGVLGDIRDPNRILIPVVETALLCRIHAVGARSRTFGHFGETFSSRSRPSRSAHTRGYVFSSRSGAPGAYFAPSFGGILGVLVRLRAPFASLHVVFALQLPLLLLCPESVESTPEGLGGILVLQVHVGIGVFDPNIVGGTNRDVGFIFGFEGVPEFVFDPVLT